MGRYPYIMAAAAVALLAYLPFNALQGIPRSGGNVVHLELVYSNGSVSHVNAYMATTVQQQEQGLMYRTSMGSCDGLGKCYGMLFGFQNQSSPCFWMKNTAMPLKQFWITGNVITSEYNATPYSTNTVCNPGSSVLETYPNSTLMVGDHVYLAFS